MKLVKLIYKTPRGTERGGNFIKIKAGYIPITILRQIESFLDIISEEEININENTGNF
jgi:hypothetical protein